MSTARSVLVVTASHDFGTSVQHTLEDNGPFKVMLVDSVQEALLCISAVAFSIAILDSDIPGGSTLALATEMRQKIPRMRLMVLASPNHLEYPALEAFKPDSLMNMPVALPDLVETINSVLQKPNPGTKPAPVVRTSAPVAIPKPALPPAPEWLQDVNWAAQHLTRLSLECSAQAALILREGALWAYAGQLSLNASQELAERLSDIWETSTHPSSQEAAATRQRGDIVRFLRLDTTQVEYMIYATSLGRDMVLSLAFDADTPFSKIRTQAGFLTRALATPPGKDLSLNPNGQRAIAGQTDPGMASPTSSTQPVLLKDVPPPSPLKKKPASPGIQGLPAWVEPLGQQPVTTNERFTEVEQRPAAPLFAGDGKPAPLSVNYPDLPIKIEEQATPVDQQQLHPPFPTLHYLTFSCMLVPRLPEHELEGNLPDQIEIWLHQLSQAYGWKLLQLRTDPQYLQWVARTTPDISPGHLIGLIRGQLSRHIFSSYPHLAQANPSGDFWSPGYLIISSPALPSAPITQHFIDQVRQQQSRHLRSNLSPD